MEIDLELLTIQNPWWSGQQFKYDPVLGAFDKSALQWRPKLLDKIDLHKDQVYTIQGPRGVGKTTAAKLLIKKLIEEDKINPMDIFYYSCHNLNTYEQLNELIKTFILWRRGKERKTKTRLYIFIDEITLIKNWQEGIKYLRTAGMLERTTVLLSGSILSRDEVGEHSQIATSLSFSEFVKLLNPELYAKVGDHKNYEQYKDNLEYYLDIYFLTGGFVSAINEFKEQGAVKQGVYSNYLYWLMTDLAKMGRDIILFRQILEKVIVNMGKVVGYKTLSTKTKAKTHLTAAEYVDILEALFAIKVIYQRGSDGQPSKSKAKKIYFRDPFLFWIFYSHIYGSLNYWQFSRERLHREEVFENLVENVVFAHLLKNKKMSNWDKRVTYWRDNIKKQEIDFVVNNNDKTTAILVRYKKEITETDKKVFKKAKFDRGLIITYDDLELHSNIKRVPLLYFLLYFQELI